MSLVFLVGMPGVGKTYWGRLMSAEMQCRFVDMDEYIAQGESRSVAEIFKVNGEQHFRQLETGCIEKIIRNDKAELVIIACGGGAPVHKNNMQLMKKNGCVVYLKAEMNTLAGRIKQQQELRPMFTDNDTISARLTELYQSRHAVYEQAHHIVDTTHTSVEDFKKLIELCINRQ